MERRGGKKSNYANRTFIEHQVATAFLPWSVRLLDATSLSGYILKDKKNTPVEVFRFAQQAKSFPYEQYTPYVIRYVGGATNYISTTNTTVYATPISRITYDADNVSGTYSGAPTAVGLHGTTITDPDTGAPWGLYGTTETITNALAMSYPWNAWILNSNTWYSLGTQAITPMRAFLYSTDPTAAAKPTFELADIDDSTTGIASIDTDEPTNSVETRIYNTSGLYLGKDINALPNGLYIVNGKKVIK